MKTTTAHSLFSSAAKLGAGQVSGKGKWQLCSPLGFQSCAKAVSSSPDDELGDLTTCLGSVTHVLLHPTLLRSVHESKELCTEATSLPHLTNTLFFSFI